MTRQYLGAETRAKIIALVAQGGIPVRRITETIGAHVANVRSAVSILSKSGKIHTVRAWTPECVRCEMWCFSTAEARDEFHEARKAASKAAQKEFHRKQAAMRKAAREAEGRTWSARSAAASKREEARAKARALARAEAEMAKMRERLAGESKEAEGQRQKAEAASQKKALQAMTKAAGALVFKGGTASPAPVKARGPAMLPGDPDTTRAKITVAPPPRDRFATDRAPSIFGALPLGEYIAPAPAWLAGVAA